MACLSLLRQKRRHLKIHPVRFDETLFSCATSCPSCLGSLLHRKRIDHLLLLVWNDEYHAHERSIQGMNTHFQREKTKSSSRKKNPHHGTKNKNKIKSIGRRAGGLRKGEGRKDGRPNQMDVKQENMHTHIGFRSICNEGAVLLLCGFFLSHSPSRDRSEQNKRQKEWAKE